MAHFSTLHDYRFAADADDIRGSELYGRDDQKLGAIVDVIFEHSSGAVLYAVIEPEWLTGGRFLVPASQLLPRPGQKQDFAADLLREQVERLPEYHEGVLRDEETWRDYEARYRTHLAAGPVMHREGSDRLITPEPQEVPSPLAGMGASKDKRPLAPSPAGEEDVWMSEPVSNTEQEELPPARRQYGEESVFAAREPRAAETPSRFHSFEELLRRNRVDITASCRSCRAERERAA